MAKQTRRRKKRRRHRRNKNRHGPTKTARAAAQVGTPSEPENPGPAGPSEPENPGLDAALATAASGHDAASVAVQAAATPDRQSSDHDRDATSKPKHTAATSDQQSSEHTSDILSEPEHTAAAPDQQSDDLEALAPVVLAPVRSVPVEHISLDPGAAPRAAPVRTPQRLPPALRAATNRNARRRAAPLVRAFMQGALIGLFVMTPAFAVTLYGMAQLGMGTPQAGFAITLGLTAAFAGVPATVLAGGIGRTTALMAALPVSGSRPRAIRSATFSAAVIGVGLCVLAAVPLRYVPPEQPVRWLWLAGAGAVVGGMGGLVLGYWVVQSFQRAPRRQRS